MHQIKYHCYGEQMKDESVGYHLFFKGYFVLDKDKIFGRLFRKKIHFFGFFIFLLLFFFRL